MLRTKKKISARRRATHPAHSTLRGRIRNTARELFARQGYESVSMRRIGTAVGCSPMAIYRHYENKEELLLSICEETFSRMIQLLDQESAKPGPALQRLRNCVRTIVDFHLSHPNHYKVTFMTPMPPGPVAQRKVAIGMPAMDRLRNG